MILKHKDIDLSIYLDLFHSNLVEDLLLLDLHAKVNYDVDLAYEDLIDLLLQRI